MCGILGWFSTSHIDQNAYVHFSNALNTMVHRGPDDWGIAAIKIMSNQVTVKSVNSPEAIEKNSVALLGHRRLSIIDLSAAGHQPMKSRDGKLWITYNGEVFNYIELKLELQGLGHSFLTHTDTEVVLTAYQQWGADCFRKFNGMWGMAIVDLVSEKVHLSRDHFGIKPLYYVQNRKGLYFSSTIRSILELSGIDRRANESALFDFLLSGDHTCNDETYCEGVYEVPPAHLLTFDFRAPNHQPHKTRWWRIGQNRIESDDPETTFIDIFESAVNIRLRSDVRLGSCLSGGLDSSSIVTAMAHQLGGSKPVETITCCYDGSEYNEEQFARQVVETTSSIGYWPRPQKQQQLSDDLEHLVLGQEKPFAGLAIYSQYCVMREAKKAGITVLLDGQGGDELLLGYGPCHITRLNFMVRSHQFGKAFRLATQLTRNDNFFSFAKIFNSIAPDLIPFPELFRFFIRNILRQKRREHPVCEFLNPELFEKYRFRQVTSSMKNITDYRYSWIEKQPLPQLLHHEDRNSMAFYIETRLPFLDYRLADFAFNTPAETLMNDGWSKVFLRRYLEKAKMPEVAWRREKMGFNTPTAALMEQSTPYFQDVCRKSLLQSDRFLNAGRLKRLLDDEVFTDWHWRMMSVELWMQSLGIR